MEHYAIYLRNQVNQANGLAFTASWSPIDRNVIKNIASRHCYPYDFDRRMRMQRLFHRLGFTSERCVCVYVYMCMFAMVKILIQFRVSKKQQQKNM